jgi:ABC-type dipeptide/oligopeptide/nickel transport system permease subunit
VTTIADDISNQAGIKADPQSPLGLDGPRSLGRDAWRRLRRSKLAIVCLAVVVVYVVVGFASLLPVFDAKIHEPLNADQTYQPPTFVLRDSSGHAHLAPPAYWLGLEVQGRSVFWRVLYGTRMALLITVFASLLSISIGVVLGVLAGYFGGWVDDVITWVFSVVSSIPWLILVIALAYVIQGSDIHPYQNYDTAWHSFLSSIIQLFSGVTTVILALGLTDWVGLCRLMRAEVMKLRERDFVMAATSLGIGKGRIIFRHILPNTLHLIIITFSLGAVSYVQVEVILAFLGLGVGPEKPSWGRMINDAKLELLRGVWWQVTAATVAIFILSLALNLLGDFLRDALDPKLRGVD